MHKKKYILDAYGREPASPDELAQCVIKVIESQLNGSHTHNHYQVVGFAWDIRYSDLVSNSHSSPEGYPQNWEGRDTAPRVYPGWSGRVWIRYADDTVSWGSSPFERTLTHTGTGGAGSYDGPWRSICSHRWNRYKNMRSIPADAYPEPRCYSWDYRFYDLDWPLLAQWVEKPRMWAELSGQPWDNRHRFEWTDPEVLAEDARFIAGCATIKAKETA
jgi:hypothetical protein